VTVATILTSVYFLLFDRCLLKEYAASLLRSPERREWLKEQLGINVWRLEEIDTILDMEKQ
jgi:hypothetical protein